MRPRPDSTIQPLMEVSAAMVELVCPAMAARAARAGKLMPSAGMPKPSVETEETVETEPPEEWGAREDRLRP